VFPIFVYLFLTLGVERVRNTLSHEMCHVACWLIDGQIKGRYLDLYSAISCQFLRQSLMANSSTNGALANGVAASLLIWHNCRARRVERKDPVIEISVEHTYDIYYPFEWGTLIFSPCDKTAQIVLRMCKL
jgi:hypothetical protein